MTTPQNHIQHKPYWPGRISALLPLGLFAWFAYHVPKVQSGAQLRISFDWVPSMDIQLAFVLDGLSLLFILIITGIGFIIAIYSDSYMRGGKSMAHFYLYLHAFLLSMLGLVLSDHLLLLFVFWELTTLFSFLLIGFDHESEAARSAARQSMLVTGGGGLALLVGILLIKQLTGTYSISRLTWYIDLLQTHALYLPILLCVMAAAFTKSAQFPFHFWLPNAMNAPTPISAFLHSATMVKAGIYLLARLHPTLGSTPVWMTTLVIVGAITAVWGATVALAQHDLKRMLAHTTIMALGIMTMFLGGRTAPALTAAITFLLVHALYKSSLFMVIGAVDHQTGSRDIRKIRGIGKMMPITATAACMAALSMAGFPLFLGFIGKEIMYKGALTEDVFPGVATTAALLANALMVAVAAIIALKVFWAKKGPSKSYQEAPWQIWSGPLLIGAVGLGFGMIPEWVARWLVEPAVLAFHPTQEDIQLKLFYGFNEPLLLSILTLILGTAAFWGYHRLQRCIYWVLEAAPTTMQAAYDGLLALTTKSARWQTRLLQNGSLFSYLTVIISVTLLIVAWALISSEAPRTTEIKLDVPGWLALLLVSMLASIGVVMVARSRLLAISGLGVIGIGMAVIFFAYGAPDVGLTQILVETLTLIIAAVVLLRLPAIQKSSSPNAGRRLLSLVVAVASGAVVTGLLMSVNQHGLDRAITDFYEQASYIQAHGRNIVNVILVDFRSLDTMGEIIVVAASALGALALIQKQRMSR